MEAPGFLEAGTLHIAPGVGPPEHSHPQAECFYVLEGSFDFMVGGSRIEKLTADSLVFVPGKVPHTFVNSGTGEGHLLGLVTPAGVGDFFRKAGPLIAADDQEGLRLLREEYQMEMVGPPIKPSA